VGGQCFQREEQVSGDQRLLLGGKSEVPGEEKDGRFVATEKQKQGERNEPCKRGLLPKDASRVERMKRKLKTKGGSGRFRDTKMYG
jgi:hypothetical protein